MRKKVLGFVFAAVLMIAMAVPLLSGGTALASGGVRAPDNDNGNAPECTSAGNDAADDGIDAATAGRPAITTVPC